jgi:hypothetical protein
MRQEPFVPMEYKHQELMDDLNEFMINAKVWLFDEAAKLRDRRPKPTPKEMDQLMFRLLDVLKKDARPMRRT